VKVIESMRIRKSPELKSLNILNNLKALKEDSILLFYRTVNSSRETITIDRSKILNSSLKKLFKPNPIDLNTVSKQKTIIKNMLKLYRTIYD
jgi:hypothetical protein